MLWVYIYWAKAFGLCGIGYIRADWDMIPKFYFIVLQTFRLIETSPLLTGPPAVVNE